MYDFSSTYLVYDILCVSHGSPNESNENFIIPRKGLISMLLTRQLIRDNESNEICPLQMRIHAVLYLSSTIPMAL